MKTRRQPGRGQTAGC